MHNIEPGSPLKKRKKLTGEPAGCAGLVSVSRRALIGGDSEGRSIATHTVHCMNQNTGSAANLPGRQAMCICRKAEVVCTQTTAFQQNKKGHKYYNECNLTIQSENNTAI